MPHALDQILPSLQALGTWSYWIIGAAAMLEAFFVTGVFVPGSLIVDAGGVLAQQGVIDVFDLCWFVAFGSILGGELGYWTGILARRGLGARLRPETSPSYQRAERLFRRHGGLALVIGRFLGPVSGLVPFVAAVAGMDRRRFALWNVVSGFPYAAGHVAFGYVLGDAMTRIGPVATRMAALAGAVLLGLALLWWMVIRIERKLPVVLSILRSIAGAVARNPDARAWARRRPAAAAFLARRFDMSRFSGLPATLLAGVFVYLAAVWAGSALDLLLAEPVARADARLAELIRAFWTPGLLRLFAHVTALGDWRAVAALTGATLAWLWLRRRPDLMLGLAAATAGDVVTVAALKRIFHRPRPELAYFAETSGSFPSGHAAIAVAFWGMLCFIGWRLGRLGPIMAALLGATLAFVIGLSRLYLVEHYLSDVINGWLVGAMWLVIGIAVAEWRRETRPLASAPPSPASRAGAAAAAALLCAVAVWTVAAYDKARAIPPARLADRTVADVAAVFAGGGVPAATESLIGAPREPINLVVLARDEAALAAAMRAAGWSAARGPGVAALVRSGWTALTGPEEEGEDEDDEAPVAPRFWRGRPNDLAFRAPAPGGEAGRPAPGARRARFWRAGLVTPEGLRVFVGTVGRDDDEDVGEDDAAFADDDAARDRLVEDLVAAGMAARRSPLRLAPAPAAGSRAASAGGVVLLTLK